MVSGYSNDAIISDIAFVSSLGLVLIVLNVVFLVLNVRYHAKWKKHKKTIARLRTVMDVNRYFTFSVLFPGLFQNVSRIDDDYEKKVDGVVATIEANTDPDGYLADKYISDLGDYGYDQVVSKYRLFLGTSKKEAEMYRDQEQRMMILLAPRLGYHEMKTKGVSADNVVVGQLYESKPPAAVSATNTTYDDDDGSDLFGDDDEEREGMKLLSSAY